MRRTVFFIEGVLFLQLLSGNPSNLLPLAFSLKKWQPCVTSKEKQPCFSPVLLL